MLDLIEAAHPDWPLLPVDPERRGEVRTLMDLGVAVQGCLSACTRATESNDYDIAVYRLRHRLERLEALALRSPDLDDTGIDLAGVVLGPTLWRLHILDQHCETYFLSGLPRLQEWERKLSAQPAMRAVFHPGMESIYLATLERRAAALISVADAATWRLLVGHDRGLRGAG